MNLKSTGSGIWMITINQLSVNYGGFLSHNAKPSMGPFWVFIYLFFVCLFIHFNLTCSLSILQFPDLFIYEMHICMNMCVTESSCISCVFFFESFSVWWYCPISICLLLLYNFYFVIIPYNMCFFSYEKQKRCGSWI